MSNTQTIIIVENGMVTEVYSDAWYNDIEIIDLDTTDEIDYDLASERANEVRSNPDLVAVY